MGDIEPNSRDGGNSTDQKSADLSRRSFLIKGAITTPILASFISKPVWAVDDSCINSGSMSGNLSNHRCSAVSRSSLWWAGASLSLWPAAIMPSTMFSSLFQRNPLLFADGTYHEIQNKNKPLLDSNGNPVMRTDGDKSLQQVLNSGEQADRELIASFLNISHPGIAYEEITDPTQLLLSYQDTIASYTDRVKNTPAPTDQTAYNFIFDNYAGTLAISNTDFDQT